jgi:outer membrane protein TolC
MRGMKRKRWIGPALLTSLASAAALLAEQRACCQAPALCHPVAQVVDAPMPVPMALPESEVCDRPLPINLPTALQLANVRPLDIALASQRIRLAAAELERARVLWLPTVYLGPDYFRHDGQQQDTSGNIIGSSRSSVMVGAGPYAVFALTDAIFSPLAARQTVRAREAALQAATNDTMLAVAETYFTLQQARGELAGADDVARRTQDLVRRTEQLVPRLAPPVEAVRATTELARRRQAVHAAREHWHVTSADLARLLRLEASALVEPLEPPHIRVTLVDEKQPVDDLIRLALTYRPELASQQALVQATLQRLRQERLRPLVPSVLLRGASTPVTGTLAGGVFGGGMNDRIANFSARSDFDVQVLWELQNLGFGNRARVNERRAEHYLSLIEQFRIQDRVAAEVVQAHAQAHSAAARLREAELEVRDAVDSANKNLEGVGQTRGAGNLIVLVIRPQEAVAAVQALGQAYSDYYGAVADFNRAQFRLYRALGQPAQLLGSDGECCPAQAPTGTRALLGQPQFMEDSENAVVPIPGIAFRAPTTEAITRP